jgi:hypothetical protein
MSYRGRRTFRAEDDHSGGKNRSIPKRNCLLRLRWLPDSNPQGAVCCSTRREREQDERARSELALCGRFSYAFGAVLIQFLGPWLARSGVDVFGFSRIWYWVCFGASFVAGTVKAGGPSQQHQQSTKLCEAEIWWVIFWVSPGFCDVFSFWLGWRRGEIDWQMVSKVYSLVHCVLKVLR